MEKVKIPKKIANMIETIWSAEEKKRDYSTFDYDEKHITLTNWRMLEEEYPDLIDVPELIDYAEDNMITYVRALIDGYEIEKTPEEKLLSIYQMYEKAGLEAWHPTTKEQNHLICQGIKIAVDTLGYEIEGINA